MKKISKKKVGIAGLAALALIGGTFAYYTSSVSLGNPLSTGSYQTTLVEEFTPPSEDLQPGAELDKTVKAENIGDYPVLVRIQMNEKWQYKNGSEYKTLGSESNLFTNDVASPSNASPDYYLAQQEDDTDGHTPASDGTVIHKNIVETADGWVDGGDGYWYWNGVLEEAGSGKSTTTNFLDGLVVTTNIDLGHYDTTEYYAIASASNADAPSASDSSAWTAVDYTGVGDVWPADKDGITDIRDYLYSIGQFPLASVDKLYRMSSSAIDPDAKGYADSNYTLSVTVEFVQATVDAVTESWSGWANVKDNLTNITTNNAEYVNNN
ncbi:MAG: BsaA family SipW-dependent biofilm matrix protein [Clostridiales bacterium]|nr:BsaA family SipW-dependent biofilm matrix protein [Clostridiales bacterium]